VSGHGFNRAVTAAKSKRLQPLELGFSVATQTLPPRRLPHWHSLLFTIARFLRDDSCPFFSSLASRHSFTLLALSLEGSEVEGPLLFAVDGRLLAFAANLQSSSKVCSGRSLDRYENHATAKRSFV
jgi:hypothetical protein